MQDSRTLAQYAIQMPYFKHSQVVITVQRYSMIHLNRIMNALHSVTNLQKVLHSLVKHQFSEQDVVDPSKLINLFMELHDDFVDVESEYC